jgi:hypothetical protein
MSLSRNALTRMLPVVVVALCALLPSSAFATATEAKINSSVNKGLTYLKGL